MGYKEEDLQEMLSILKETIVHLPFIDQKYINSVLAEDEKVRPYRDKVSHLMCEIETALEGSTVAEATTVFLEMATTSLIHVLFSLRDFNHKLPKTFVVTTILEFAMYWAGNQIDAMEEGPAK